MSQQEHLFKFQVQQNYYLQATSTGIKVTLINIKNQLLFKDVQFMLENGYLAAVMWNKEIEEQIQGKIIQIQQQNDKAIFSLKDLYFSDVQQQKLEVINYQVANEGNKPQVLNELKKFGKKIRSMNKLLAGQFGQYKLDDLLKHAINFFGKIKLKKVYSPQQQEEQIRLRYIIEQILTNPNPNENQIIFYKDEDELVRITQNYINLLKPSKLNFGQFFISQFFGKTINQLKYQYDFLVTVKNVNQNLFYEKLEVQANDFSKFKQWAIVWTVEKYLNFEKQINHPIVVQNVLEILEQSQYLVKYSNLKDEDIFQFLLSLSEKIKISLSETKQVALSYEQNEIKIQIKNVIDIIRQKRNITDMDIENMDEKVLIEKLYKEKYEILTSNATLIGYLDFTRDIQSFIIIENFYLTYILTDYGNQLKNFFFDQTGEAPSYILSIVQGETAKMQQQGQMLIKATVNIFNAVKSLLNKSKLNQDQQYDQCLQDYPEILKAYFQNSFKKKQNTPNKISMFVQQQSKQFKKQLDWYKQYLQQQTQEVFLKLSNDIKDHVLQTVFLKLTEKWIKSFEIKLLNLFIPYINMQELIKTKQFTDICQEEIILQQRKYDYLYSKFQVYQQFIQASLNSYKQVKIINPDQEVEIKVFENNLLEQQMWKIQELEFDQKQQPEEFIMKMEEKNEMNFQIKEFMNKSISVAIQNKIQSIQQKKCELFEQYKNQFDCYYLPFQCLENEISQVIQHESEMEQETYLKKLKDFSQRIGIQVENKCKNFQRSLNFGFTDKTIQDLQIWIKQLIIEEFNELKLDEQCLNQFISWVDEKIEYFYGFSEEQINTKIQEKQDYFLNQYLREIYEITDQQCKEILIPDIPLDKLEIDKLQEYRPQFIIIVEESQNQQDLERRTFQYFQKQALSFVLENYQNQIEKRLKEINDPD